ncbi:MAG: ABC transporter ATP-binding protein [Henriciella sp.]|nr:ABC transporter ATP-binding protein [Henriciella sp.]
MSSRAPLIAETVSRSFSGNNAVDAVSLTLEPGKITSLIGHSGSGKTTLLRLFAGMERPDSGRILSGSIELSGPKSHVPIERRRIGLVFQDFALFPHLSVRENVGFGLKRLQSDERNACAERWIEKLGLSHRIDAYPHQLSGGEQQRTAIARALAPEPVAILLDEPFSGLDPAMRDQVRDAALEAVRNAGIPSLLVTHDAKEAMVHSDKVAIIDRGKILQTGTPETLYNAPVSELAARALGPVHQIKRSNLPAEWLSQVSGSADAVAYRPEALQVSPGSGFRVIRQRLAGAVSEIEIEGIGGESLFAVCQLGSKIQSGDDVSVGINPALFFDFKE